ncbi:histidine phosphatase family protein [Paenibacillus sp. FSL K6-1217]|uniref:histidine phosphatase family protein n=1 Tax=Paenibacillus sp. FSL K6-1217 TaxID=2921466 RepID=UPI003255EB4B
MEKVQAGRAEDSSPAVQEAQEAQKAKNMQETREAQVAPKLQSTRSPLAQPDQPELELVLVRHGYTQWNKEHRYLGRTDVPLAPGETERLQQLRTQVPLTGEFRRVYCSDLRRCRETLAALVPHLKPQAVYDARLREMDFGAWEGCTYEQLKDNPLYRSWIDNPEAATTPGGEAWAQFAARIDHFWTELQQEAEAPAVTRILLVTHGGVIRQLLARMIGGVTFYTAAAPAPGEVTVLRLRRDGGSWHMAAGNVDG